MVEDVAKRRLGRGLAALIGDVEPETGVIDRARAPRKLPIEFLRPNPRNPRDSFDKDELSDLARSVKEKGVIQPILVRPLADQPDQYEIIAGERRWRAAQIAGLAEIPVIVQEVTDKEALELAIIENVQRTDLNPLEEALGYERLLSEFSYSQSVLADVLGKSRSHVANTIRLLKLSDGVKDYLRSGALTAGHARALIGREDADALADLIVRGDMTVREAEKIAASDRIGDRPGRKESGKDADTLALEKELTDSLGLTVAIQHRPGGAGSVSIKYKSIEQLDDIVRRLKNE